MNLTRLFRFAMEDFIKIQSLNDLKLELQSLRGRADEKFKKYKELEEALEQITLIISETSGVENAASPSASKRRRISRASSESNDSQFFENHLNSLEETRKRIDIVKRVLSIIYEIENVSFKKFISKNGKKRRNVVSKVHLLKRIMENGQAIPLWIGKEEEKPPALCGAIAANDSYIAEVGDMVAACITQDTGSSWILAEVISYTSNTKEYVVDDVYEEQKLEQLLGYDKIIPLPRMRADPETNPEALFQNNSLVLALYPGTTCFYRAFVSKVPVKHEDPYILLFEDDAYETGYSTPITVHQRYVIPFKNTGD